jgi:hypothetical protein
VALSFAERAALRRAIDAAVHTNLARTADEDGYCASCHVAPRDGPLVVWLASFLTFEPD